MWLVCGQYVVGILSGCCRYKDGNVIRVVGMGFVTITTGNDSVSRRHRPVSFVCPRSDHCSPAGPLRDAALDYTTGSPYIIVRHCRTIWSCEEGWGEGGEGCGRLSNMAE